MYHTCVVLIFESVVSSLKAVIDCG